MTEKQLERKKMNEFFLSIWAKRPHKSELSGKSLGKEPLTIYFHHLLSKSKYPFAKYDRQNVILITGDEHANVESNPSRYEEINKRVEILKTKYNI